MFLTPAILSHRDCDEAPFYLQSDIVLPSARRRDADDGSVATKTSNSLDEKKRRKRIR